MRGKESEDRRKETLTGNAFFSLVTARTVFFLGTTNTVLFSLGTANIVLFSGKTNTAFSVG